MEQELEKSASIENHEIFVKKEDKVSAFKSLGRVFFEAFYQWAFGRLPDFKTVTTKATDVTINTTTQHVTPTIKKLEPSTPINEKEIHNEISNEFDRYLNNNVWSFAVEFIENGYKPSRSQLSEYKKMLAGVIQKNDSFLSELIKITPLIHEDIMELIVDKEHFIFELVSLKQKLPASVAVAAVIKLASSEKELTGEEYKKFKNLVLNNVHENDFSHILNVVNSKAHTATAELLDNLVIEYKSIGCIGKRNRDKVETFKNKMDNYFHLINILENKLHINELEFYNKNILSIEKSLTDKARNISSCHKEEYFQENCDSLNI